jgi:hypothetical protein
MGNAVESHVEQDVVVLPATGLDGHPPRVACDRRRPQTIP